MKKRIIVVFGWVALFVSWFVWQRSTGRGPVSSTQQLIDAVSGKWWAVLAFLVLSVIRPLVLFPATLLTIAAGLLFGPVGGVAVAIIGSNASAMVGWSAAVWIAPKGVGAGRKAVAAWTDRLQRNSFEAVLLMRLLFLPYDLVNYGCGLLRVKWRPFLLATAIGSIPGTVAFVLAGASVKRLDQGIGGIDGRVALVSVLLVAISIGISQLLKHRFSGVSER
jgi:uncharacterized membrane protein YdjX (TVP38/TMEM64 family)